MTHPHLRRLIGVGLAAAVASATAACAPGEETDTGTETGADEVQTDISELGDVTLTVWDQEVRGGQAEQIEALNAAFQEEYPNVTIDRTKRSFNDLQRTLRNAITSDEAPDVVQANNGRSDMGAFVGNGLLQSLDGYAEAYGWTERFPESVRSLASYSEDGAVFGEGNLYGLPQVGELVGVWYNKSKLQELGLEVPRTTEEFQAALQTAKDAGELPIQFGNLDGWPGIFTPDFNGVGYDPSWQDFAKGEGVFLVSGTWLQADLTDALGDDVGFFLPPTGGTGELAVTGGTGLPFSITDASENADVAAAYIDFITSDEAMQMIQEAGNLPVVGGTADGATGAAADVLDAWTTAGEQDALVPYLDYATPEFYDLLTAQVQELGNGSVDGQQFLATLEDEYTGFVSGS